MKNWDVGDWIMVIIMAIGVLAILGLIASCNVDVYQSKMACEASAQLYGMETKYDDGECHMLTPEFGWMSQREYFTLLGKQQVLEDK